MTIFVYLNNVHKGGRTRWRWTNHDAALGGEHGTRFYDRPNCGSGRTAVEGGSGVEVSIEPREGMGVIHFPAMLPEVRCPCLTRATATAAILSLSLYWGCYCCCCDSTFRRHARVHAVSRPVGTRTTTPITRPRPRLMKSGWRNSSSGPTRGWIGAEYWRRRIGSPAVGGRMTPYEVRRHGDKTLRHLRRGEHTFMFSRIWLSQRGNI